MHFPLRYTGNATLLHQDSHSCVVLRTIPVKDPAAQHFWIGRDDLLVPFQFLWSYTSRIPAVACGALYGGSCFK